MQSDYFSLSFCTAPQIAAYLVRAYVYLVLARPLREFVNETLFICSPV